MIIKKPKPQTLSSLLRMTPESEIQLKKDKKAYEYSILVELVKEFGTASLGELLFCVVEKYHGKLKVKKSAGVRQKWTGFLNAMVRVEIDTKRAAGIKLHKAITELTQDKLWKKFALKTSDGGVEVFKKAYSKGKNDTQSYLLAKKLYERDYSDWEDTIKSQLKRFNQNI
jgi:hypothetical protein